MLIKRKTELITASAVARQFGYSDASAVTKGRPPFDRLHRFYLVPGQPKTLRYDAHEVAELLEQITSRAATNEPGGVLRPQLRIAR